MNFQEVNDTEYRYIKVGSWKTGNLDMLRPIQFNTEAGRNMLPESVCSKPCAKGQMKVKMSNHTEH